MAEAKRAELVERVAEVNEQLGEAFLLEEPITADELAQAIRRATLSLNFVPVFMGRSVTVLFSFGTGVAWECCQCSALDNSHHVDTCVLVKMYLLSAFGSTIQLMPMMSGQ